MLKITDYGFLFQSMNGGKASGLFGKSSSPFGTFQLSQLNSSAVQSQLRAAGIDTNSNQYKAVIKKMMNAANGSTAMYTNVNAIKNLMSRYDKDGDYIDPVTGLAGLLVTEENIAGKNRIINIPESSREEMFELTKREFLRENGVCNGDTTKRSDVYTNMYRKMKKEDRLAAGHTLGQYERAYRQAFIDAVRSADPNWQVGMPIKAGVLDNITREDVERSLVQNGSKLERRTVDYSV